MRSKGVLSVVNSGCFVAVNVTVMTLCSVGGQEYGLEKRNAVFYVSQHGSMQEAEYSLISTDFTEKATTRRSLLNHNPDHKPLRGLFLCSG